MLHGLMIDDLSSLYFTAAPALADVADVVLYDLRGHGRTEQPATGYGPDEAVADLIGVLDALGLTEPVYLLGNSVGGTIALAAAMAHPDRVAGLMLLEAHVTVPGWGEVMADDVDLAGYGMGEADLQEWLGARGGRKLRQLVTKAQQLASETTVGEDLRNAEDMTEAALAAISCPTLLVYGQYSDVLHRAELLQQTIPHAELALFLDCSHSVLVEATTTLRTVLADWFRRALAGQAAENRLVKIDVGPDEGSGEVNHDLVTSYKTELARRQLLSTLAERNAHGGA
jgi:pimeloyl-ACP methyl ester carboxylesterase